MRVLDLFSGIGGFSLGLERAGMTTVAFCEIEPYCRAVLRKHWPEVPIYDDVRELTAERLAADGIGVDLICGGFPCQDISTAGAGAGLAGERSGLWQHIPRLAGELIAAGADLKYLILENVAALLGRGLGDVLRDLAALGFDAEWHCIPASAVGAPHRRDRVWIVAYPRGEQHEGDRAAFERAGAAELPQTVVANANGLRPTQSARRERASWLGSLISREIMAHAAGVGRNQGPANAGGRRQGMPAHEWSRSTSGGWWLTEPDVGRVAHGVPARVDRLGGLGNAVVPQIPEIIGRAILAAEASA